MIDCLLLLLNRRLYFVGSLFFGCLRSFDVGVDVPVDAVSDPLVLD